MRMMKNNNNETVMVIGIDHGYGNMKTATRCFPSGVARYDKEPICHNNLLVYNGMYYQIGEEHKEFCAEKTQEKYYLADVSLKYALLGYNRKMLDGTMENIVFLELRRRGYEVFVGKNETKEIDFVATRQDEKIYVQVCVQIPENSEREVGNLMVIKDHYPKYVVTLNEMDAGIENGIRIVHLADFLLAEQW